MPRSNTRGAAPGRFLFCFALTSLCLLAGVRSVAQTLLPGTTRFVDLIDLADHDDHADISVQFTCSLSYVTHQPEVEGDELRLQLRPLPDCGVSNGAQIAGELPPVSGGENIIAAARVESDIPGQVTLVLSFKKVERFVVAQAADLHGIRVRLVGRGTRNGKVIVSAPVDTISRFAINLESQLKPFDAGDLQTATARLQLPAYVAEVTVDDQRWYRLRVGPLDRQSDAQRVLNQALTYYPRAWLARGDDSSTTAEGAAASPPVSVERIGSDPALDQAARQQLVDEARTEFGKKDYTQAIKVLTKLQRQPEFGERAEMQELLGIAYERLGQLAQAKAEYEEYLYRYPAGAAVNRVRERLRVLRTAGNDVRGLGQGGAGRTGWTINGGVGQLFRYDGTNVSNNQVVPAGTAAAGAANTTQTTGQDALYNDIDLLARRRGERYSVVARFSGGYARDFSSNDALSGTSPNIRRISLASVDVTDSNWGLLARVGRQTRNEGGVLGTFDGALFAWQFRPAWNVNVTYGFPVEQTSDGIKTGRQFEAASLAYTPPGSHWDASVFFTEQTFDHFRDRQAVGLDARYLRAWLALTGLVDYDTFYHSLNAAALLGTLQLPARWNVSFDAEHRNAPVLTTGNALIGQPDTTLKQLEAVFTHDEIDQLARDRTPVSSNYSLTATRPLGDRYQFAATATADRIGPTVGSGGVSSTPDTGLETSFELQLYASSFWGVGDFNVLSAAYSNTEIGKIDDLGVTSRFPLRSAWRLGPRINVERRLIAVDGSRELDVLPSFLLDYQRARLLLQFELGGEIGSRDATLQSQRTRRYYASLAYRWAF